MNIKECNAWRNKAPDANNAWSRGIIWQAQLAMGTGSVEERLIRLMVWSGAKLHHCHSHSGLKDPILILKEGTAWCDQHVRVFCFLTWYFLGLRTCQLELRSTDGSRSHVVSEISYDGSWHLFDVHPDHQVYYRHHKLGHIMCYEEIQEHICCVLDEHNWYVKKEELYAGTCNRYEIPWDTEAELP